MDHASTVSRRVTPATSRSVTSSSNAGLRSFKHSSNLETVCSAKVILAAVEGRGIAKGEVGLASFDLTNTELIISQFPDTPSYSELRVKLRTLRPQEILLPDSTHSKAAGVETLSSLLKSEFPHTVISTLHRKFFNELHGAELVKNIKVDECSASDKDYLTKYYCLAAASAVIKYMELVENAVFASHSVKVTFVGIENRCSVDAATAKNLELLSSLNNIFDVERSLFGIMVRSISTRAGARLLRSSMLQPLADVNSISYRLDAIDECLCNPEFDQLKSIVGHMCDVDQFISLCARVDRSKCSDKMVEYKLTQLINFMQVLKFVALFRNCLKSFKNHLFRCFCQYLEDSRFEKINAVIRCSMNEDAHASVGILSMQVQKCFAIKSNVNGLLDISRRTYNELVDDVYENCREVTAVTNLPFKVAYKNGRGFFLSLSTRDTGLVPGNLHNILIKVVRNKTSINCTTRTLVKNFKMTDFSARIDGAVSNIFALSNGIVSETFNHLRPFIACLYNLAECVVIVDLVVSLTQAAKEGEYVRPCFGPHIYIEQGKHPILDRLTSDSTVANDFPLSESQKFVIITGPNMAGKSTYLKQMALLLIMAEMGSYVPVRSALVPVFKQVYSRIGHNDDLDNNNSAFTLEIKDMTYVLQNVSSNSVVIIDELGRSTSNEEGLALCFAVCETLMDVGATVMLATHFDYLTCLGDYFDCITNFHFRETTGTEGSYNNFRHKLCRGVYKGRQYESFPSLTVLLNVLGAIGENTCFELVQMSRYPREILSRAKEVASDVLIQNQKLRRESRKYATHLSAVQFGNRLASIARWYCHKGFAATNEALEIIRNVKTEFSSQKMF